MFTKNYSFINNMNTSSFIDFNDISGNTDAMRALNAGNWNHRASDENYKASFMETSEGIKILDDRQILVFKSEVPEFGSYKITVKLQATNESVEGFSIFAGRRNLVCKNVKLESNDSYEISFYTYVTPYIPALTYEPYYDKSVYVSFLGKNLIVNEITIMEERVKTIFVAGDSTLTDQNALTPYYPICSCCGWAQDLLMYTKQLAICNYAHSGLTTNCFRDDGHYDILKNQIKTGDIVIIQFGHNDQKRRNLEAFGGYAENLRLYINEIRNMGATPILCSPISRIPITDEESGEKYSLLSMHAKACKSVAKELNAYFIDLHEYTFDIWTQMSLDEVKDYFIPGDITHTNDYGAILIAEYVSKELKNINELNKNIIDVNINNFGPKFDTKAFVIEKGGSSPFDIDMPFMDLNQACNIKELSKAFKKGLMDPCVMHIHPKDPLPRAQLLMIYLRALKLNGTRPYLGQFKDIDKYEWDSGYVQTCINEKLIDLSTISIDCFRPNDSLTYEEFASFCIRGLETDIEKRSTLSIDYCLNEAIKLQIINNVNNSSEYINRENVYIGLSKLMDLANSNNKEMPTDTEMHPVH